MQFHLNGFRPGDPMIRDAAPVRAQTDKVDVLIIGCGPAGLTLAAQLARFGDIRTRIVERKDGPLEKGQADGVSCRSMEMFEAFGFAHRVMREACWVNETTFWTPNPENRANIHRAGRVQDVEDGLSEMPHVILNQARVHDMYLEQMRNGPARVEPEYEKDFKSLEISEDPDASHPVTVTLTTPSGEEVVRARYVVGCDGARSGVRQAIGQALHGDSANQIWGVMDVLAVTDFPDFRFKSVIQSDEAGTVLIIPREGGHLVRLYTEVGTLEPGERAADRGLSVDDVIAKAQRVFHPYKLDVKDVVWWSAYQIGQRICPKFDDVPEGEEATRLPRVFIAGDACHTHSPKAGQGMNVSMGDAFNLGWKLKAVLRGEAGPELLATYSAERQSVAQDLINFDRYWAQAIREKSPGEAVEDEGGMPAVQRQFIRQGRYTAGLGVTYKPSRLTGDATHQALAKGFEIGTRFHSAPVIRLGDGKTVELGHVVEADGRWRVFAFAPNGAEALCAALADPASALSRYRGSDPDDRIDLRVILGADAIGTDITAQPDMLMPHKGRLGLQDYEKVFCARRDNSIFNLRGVDRENGCLTVVRPDQYVGHVLPLDGVEALNAYFDGVFGET